MSDMKLSIDEMRGLMEAFSTSGLTSFTLRDGDFELCFASEKPEQVYVCPPAAAPAVPGAVQMLKRKRRFPAMSSSLRSSAPSTLPHPLTNRLM